MRELKKLEETTINKRIFVEIEICVREGKVMTTGSEGRSSGKAQYFQQVKWLRFMKIARARGDEVR